MTGVAEAEEMSRAWKVVEEANRWPEWVFMRLEPGDVSPDTLDLRLTINFNEHHLPLLGGQVTYGLAAGDLRLTLVGGKSPYDTREPKTPLEIQLSAERTVTGAVREQSKRTQSAGVDIEAAESKGKGTAKLQAQSELQKGAEKQTTDKFPHVVFQMTTKGAEDCPIWSFELKSEDPVLKGRLDQFKLGTLLVLEDACHILATFETLRRHIRITGGDGVWPDDLGRNKRALIDALVRKLLARRLAPYMSRLEAHYE